MPNKLKIKDISQSQLNDLLIYSQVNREVVRFENISTEKTFKFLFGDKYGERLWRAFKLSCGSKIYKFNTYLDSNQRDVLLINLYYNEEMYSL